MLSLLFPSVTGDFLFIVIPLGDRPLCCAVCCRLLAVAACAPVRRAPSVLGQRAGAERAGRGAGCGRRAPLSAVRFGAEGREVTGSTVRRRQRNSASGQEVAGGADAVPSLCSGCWCFGESEKAKKCRAQGAPSGRICTRRLPEALRDLWPLGSPGPGVRAGPRRDASASRGKAPPFGPAAGTGAEGRWGAGGAGQPCPGRAPRALVLSRGAAVNAVGAAAGAWPRRRLQQVASFSFRIWLWFGPSKRRGRERGNAAVPWAGTSPLPTPPTSPATCPQPGAAFEPFLAPNSPADAEGAVGARAGGRGGGRDPATLGRGARNRWCW